MDKHQVLLVGAQFNDMRFEAKHAQTVGPILNSNEFLRNHTDENWDTTKDMKLVGRVPQVVWLLWESMGITKDPKELLKALKRHKLEYMTTTKQFI